MTLTLCLEPNILKTAGDAIFSNNRANY